jgi:hypothetical protein
MLDGKRLLRSSLCPKSAISASGEKKFDMVKTDWGEGV